MTHRKTYTGVGWGGVIQTVNSEGLVFGVNVGMQSSDPKQASRGEPVIPILNRACAQGQRACVSLVGSWGGAGKAGEQWWWDSLLQCVP